MKLYSYGVIEFKEDEPGHHFLKGMIELQKMIQEYREGEERRDQVNFLHNLIRENLRLPNEIFTIGTKEDGTLDIILFGKQPDGNTYTVFTDDGVPYIIVESEE